MLSELADRRVAPQTAPGNEETLPATTWPLAHNVFTRRYLHKLRTPSQKKIAKSWISA